MAIFTKGLIGAGLAGTVVLGTMVTWNGGLTVDSAKDKITEAATQIGVFKTNETALVSKVTSLKNEKATLTAEVASLKVELAAEKAKNVTDNQRILDLEAEIATKNAKITELESEIATLNTDLENAAGNTAEITERIDALEAELNAANEQAEELQYTLDTTVFAEPDQTAVDAALEPTEGIPDTGGEGEAELVYDVNVQLVTGTPHTLAGTYFKSITFDVNADGNVTVTNLHGFDITVDSTTIASGTNVVIGTPASLDGTIVTVANPYGESQLVYLTQN